MHVGGENRTKAGLAYVLIFNTMATIGVLKRRIQKTDVGFIASESIDQTKEAIILQQQAQLFGGLNSKEESIVPPYRPRTIQIKTRKGQPTDRVTLRDKGDFYKGIFVDVREETFVTDSIDEKAGKLIDKYGVTIFGLGKTRRAEYVEENLRPVFVRNIKNALGL